MGNRMEVPQKTKVAMWSNNPVPGHIPRQNYNFKRQMYPMFMEALFTVVKTWKQPKCASGDEWIKMWYIHTHNGIPLSHKKNEIMPFAATQMDLRLSCWVKSIRKRQMESKIWHKWAYLWNRNRLTGVKHRFVGAKGAGLGRDGLGVSVSRCKLLHIQWVNRKVLLMVQGTYSISCNKS